MLTILTGTDWVANRHAVLSLIAEDVKQKKGNRILLVPELISHDTERRLSAEAGDTCSRFAEVLTFSRLIKRVCQWCGYGVPECLDNGGRLVAMASAARQLHNKLKAYASVETRPEFLCGLVDAIDEFKRCCISAQDLLRASGETDGAFAQKLEELSLLLEAYDAICAQSNIDPRDQMNWLIGELDECDFAAGHTFYVDGFPDFTRQHMAVLEHMICNAQALTITVNTDGADSRNPAFEKAADTLKQLYTIAKKHGIEVKMVHIPSREDSLQSMSLHLFQGNVEKIRVPAQMLRVTSFDSIYTECAYVAERIIELVNAGARYRDISVVCGDLQTYANTLQSELTRCGIPIYLAGTEDILDKSVIATVLNALDAALDGFQTPDVMRYIKSVVSALPLQMADRVENYALMWGIRGSGWTKEWTLHPRGLQTDWTDADCMLLKELNEARETVIMPLKALAEGFHNARNLQQQVEGIFTFLEQIDLSGRLDTMAAEMDGRGDYRNAQILAQLWEILLNALEQLSGVLGHTAWDAETFSRLLKLLLSQYDVGTIPSVLDTVVIGSASAMRCQETRHLIVLGANEGVFPKYAGTSGVLTDQERKSLRALGIPLTGGGEEGLQIEFSEIHNVFCGAWDSVTVSALSDQPSFVWKRLRQMSEGMFQKDDVLGATAVNREEAASFLLRNNAGSAAELLGITQECEEIKEKSQHQLGNISKDGIDVLYGQRLNLSASQVDKQADCRLAYFLKYGLRAEPRKPVEIDPAEFGTYVHAVLEDTAKEVCANGGFPEMTLEQVTEIAQKHSDVYIQAHFSQIDSDRLAYLFARNTRELMMVVEELWSELQDSDFQPVGFEVAFGDNADLSAIAVPGKNMDAQLRGFVDRVDAWRDGVKNYFRVVDYKTGQKSFDYCDVFNGSGLQMLLYLFALEQEGKELLGENPTPAGVQYFPARVPVMSADGELTDEEAAEERVPGWRRKGLLLNNDEILHAMEHTDPPTRLCCRKRKDGTITGDVADAQQLKMLKKYVFALLGNMVDEIASGVVEPNPYTRGSSHNACRFCDFSTICHTNTVEGRRNYKTMTAQRFWEEIERQVGRDG